MKKGKSYSYEDIEIFAGNEFEIIEHGGYITGESFVVLKSCTRNTVISFILTGATASKGIYECIYSDY